MATLHERFNLAAEAGLRVTIPEIKAVCADYFGVTVAEILSRRKSKVCATPRYIAYYLTFKLTPSSTGDVAREFNRSPSSIGHALLRFERRLEHNMEIKYDLGQVFDRLIAYA